MKQRYLLYTFLLFTIVASSCKKNKLESESIDYKVLTEQRIMEVSEQAVIRDTDIPPLERLLEKVDDKATRDRLTLLLEGVKIVKTVIPALTELRTNLDIDFNSQYEEVQKNISRITDQLPRRAKLQKELEDAKGSYNTEEVEFDNTPIPSTNSFLEFITQYLERNYNIKPISGKPTRFLRADIERVDHLESVGTIASNIKKFKGLKSLTVAIMSGEADLNGLVNLEHLKLGANKLIKIDQLQKLKSLEFTEGTNWTGEVLDLTNKFDLLETLIIPRSIAKDLKEVIITNKKHLTAVHFVGQYGLSLSDLPKIKKLIIEGYKIHDFAVRLGSESNREIDEVRLSGFGGINTIGEYSRFGITGSISEGTNLIKIKKLNVTDIQSQYIGLFHIILPEIPNIQHTNLKSIDFKSVWISSKLATFQELVNLTPLQSSLESLLLKDINISGGTLDLSKFTKLKTVFITNMEDFVKVPLKKIIITPAIAALNDPGDGTCDGCEFYVDDDVEQVIMK